MINVTIPFLPPKHEYQAYIDAIWERNWLTNNGPLVVELEAQLKAHLDLPYALYVTNGTIAIQLAIKALDLKGEIITTPFSYVATTSSIVWEGCKPVFVDIDPVTLNIDPKKIEEAITPQTSAILATHVYGNACDIEAIDQIAKRHGLKIIYDGAHAFGTCYRGRSIFVYGDISTTSFHATKLFHTIEGGGIFTQHASVNRSLMLMRNFGHHGPGNFEGVGINGKNSEFHAAMGLCNLKYLDEILDRKRQQSFYYDEILKDAGVERPGITSGCSYNYAYYAVLFADEKILLKTQHKLEEVQIFPRRYFYPSLSHLPYVTKQRTPICDSIAARVLCLPLYHNLTSANQDRIADILISVKRSE